MRCWSQAACVQTKVHTWPLAMNEIQTKMDSWICSNHFFQEELGSPSPQPIPASWVCVSRPRSADSRWSSARFPGSQLCSKYKKALFSSVLRKKALAILRFGASSHNAQASKPVQHDFADFLLKSKIANVTPTYSETLLVKRRIQGPVLFEDVLHHAGLRLKWFRMIQETKIASIPCNSRSGHLGKHLQTCELNHQQASTKSIEPTQSTESSASSALF